MTEPTTGEARLVAVTNVRIDEASHAPGAVFEAPEELARELIGMGAARPLEDGDGGNLEDVKGIGPKTARALVQLGLQDLDELASLDKDAVARVAKAIDKEAETVAAWRDQARELRRV